MFPIGGLLKSEVRKIASEINLVTADKKDSQGLCFVGKIKLPEFLQQKLDAKNGPVIEIPGDMLQYKKYSNTDNGDLESLCLPFAYNKNDGKQVSQHSGAHFYTIGQRKGLHIGGRPLRSFVIATDTVNNIVYSGQTDEHPGLNRIALKIEEKTLNWISQKTNKETEQYEFRIRYRQPLQKGKLIRENNATYVLFDQKQKGISPGQFVAWYKGGILLGSGVIES